MILEVGQYLLLSTPDPSHRCKSREEGECEGIASQDYLILKLLEKYEVHPGSYPDFHPTHTPA